MNTQLINRKVYLHLFIFSVFLLIPAILFVSGSVKSFAQKSNKDSEHQTSGSVSSESVSEVSVRKRAKSSAFRWVTVDENELAHIRNVVRNKGGSFELNVAEKHGGLSVIQSDERQILELTGKMHEEFHKCAGFMAHETLEEARLSIEETLRAESYQSIAAYTIDNQTSVNPMLAEARESEILETISRLSTDFPNRRYNQPSGLDSANWIKNKWEQIAAGRSDITVEFFDHSAVNSPQPSIILTIPGTTLPNEVVVLGGHQDSINLSGPTVNAPGADDDASGIASLTEVIRVLVAKNFRPQRTVKFMAYAAEEIGLVGSKAIAADFQARAVNVVGVLQLDMTNYKSADAAVDIAVITDFTNAAQNQFIRELILAYQPSLTFGNAACGYSCSDHASWTNKGFPASFPFEPRSNPTIHTTADTLAQSGNNANHAIKYAKLALSYVGELAKGNLSLTPSTPVATITPTPTPVPTNTPTATPTVPPVSFESDVAPRPSGNGAVTSADVNQTERFLRRIDTASITPNEFQRADSAPRVEDANGNVAQCGDGVIDAADLQQARLYFNQINPLTRACGPTAPVVSQTATGSDTMRGDFFGEQQKALSAAASVLTIESTSAGAGASVNINVGVAARGDEVQYGFVLSFDPKVLRFTGSSGTGASGATSASCNETAAAGEIFCAVGGFKGNLSGTSEMFGEIDSGERILISPQFVLASSSAAAGAGAQTKVSITQASASNEAAQPLVTRVVDGTVDILKTELFKEGKRLKMVSGRGISGVEKFERFKLINYNKDNKLFWL